jgi:hypothetical protein
LSRGGKVVQSKQVGSGMLGQFVEADRIGWEAKPKGIYVRLPVEKPESGLE